MTIENCPAELLSPRMAENWPDAVTPVTQLMLRVFRLNKIISAKAERCVRAQELAFTEFQVLVMLRREPPPHELVPTALYDFLQISSGGLTKVLARLADRGLIERPTSLTDRRSKPVRLTTAGRTRVERVMASVLASDGELLSRGLSAKQMDTMIELLRRLLLALEPDAVPAQDAATTP